MLRNYLTTALRNLWRQRGFSAINIIGLSAGLAACLIIGLYVQDEVSYDRYHERVDRIYRVSQDVRRPDSPAKWAWTGGAMAEDLSGDFPQIEAAVRFLPNPGTVRYERTGGGVVSLREPGFGYVDPAWFQVFSHTFLQGDPATALNAPNSVVITETAAGRYFGEENPMGKTLAFNGYLDLVVTGVIQDVPDNSHLTYAMVAPVAAFKQLQGIPATGLFGSYWWPYSFTYVMLTEGSDSGALNASMEAFAQRHREESETYVPYLESLGDLHLYSLTEDGPSRGGNISKVRIFGSIALIVLLLACINFMNLATARSAGRAREVGVRKSLGAGRRQLVIQFLGEAMLLSLIALILAAVIVEFALPAFNQLAGKSLEIDYRANAKYWAGLASLMILTGLIAGSYPALFLSRMMPAQVLKGGVSRAGGADRVRKGLVVFQFGISVVLIASTLIAVRQLDFLQTKGLGFEQEATIRLRLDGDVDYDVLRNELEQTASVLGVTSAQMPPGLGSGAILPYVTGSEADLQESEGGQMVHNQVDYDFVDQMGLAITAGRGFSAEQRADIGTWPEGQQLFHIYDRAFMVNQSAARANGWSDQEAIGKSLRLYAMEGGTYYTDLRGTIVGVVEDFHYQSLRDRIGPVAFSLAETPRGHIGGFALVKVSGTAAAALDAVEGVWSRVAPQEPFDAAYLDDELQAMYLQEQRLGRVIALFTLLGILVACLGLVGLAAFAADKRTKEIGVRKAMGASVSGLVLLLARDFLRLVAIAFAIGAPVAYLIMDRWLQGFAYYEPIGFGVFALTGLLAVVIALLSVTWQSVRAARLDPVKSLRYE